MNALAKTAAIAAVTCSVIGGSLLLSTSASASAVPASVTQPSSVASSARILTGAEAVPGEKSYLVGTAAAGALVHVEMEDASGAVTFSESTVASGSGSWSVFYGQLHAGDTIVAWTGDDRASAARVLLYSVKYSHDFSISSDARVVAGERKQVHGKSVGTVAVQHLDSSGKVLGTYEANMSVRVDWIVYLDARPGDSIRVWDLRDPDTVKTQVFTD